MGGGQGPRGDFAVLTDADLNAFRHILGADNVRTDAKSLDAANEDWMRKYRGDSRVLLPVSYTHLTLPTIYSV